LERQNVHIDNSLDFCVLVRLFLSKCNALFVAHTLRCDKFTTHRMSKADLEEKAFLKIPEYMKEQNRPYSAVDVYTNLRQEFGKTLVLKVLEASVASGVLKEKLVVKQKIFYANQDNLGEYDEAAIAESDAKINELTEKLTGISAQYKELQNELRVLSGMQTTEQLQKLTSELKEKIGRMKTQLAKFEQSDNTAVAEDGKKAMELEANMSKLLVKRKRIATDMLNAISECSPLKKCELLDSIGVELEPGEWVRMDNEEEGGFKSVSSMTYRELTEEEKKKLQQQDVVNEFKQKKLEAEAQKNWDRFYNRNRDNFFKDRNWSGQDLQDLCRDMDLTVPLTFLEAGCGVGNMLFPMKSAFPNLRLQGFDFSPRAVQMCSERATELGVS
ncbi:Tat binding protein 1(TBP-1)-interacting protein, partial [Ancylostoma caninum]